MSEDKENYNKENGEASPLSEKEIIANQILLASRCYKDGRVPAENTLKKIGEEFYESLFGYRDSHPRILNAPANHSLVEIFKELKFGRDGIDQRYLQECIENLEPKTVEDVQTSGLNFGSAIQALKEGKRVQREGWNGKGLFVFRQVPSTIDSEIIPKMQSVPQSVKNEFKNRFDSSPQGAISYNDQLALVNTSNEISGWSPSTNDALAEDWVILD